MEDFKISNEEKNRVLVKNVSDRPNALTSYGEAKKGPTETKDIFDKQFALMIAKHNALCDGVVEMVSTIREEAKKMGEELEESVAKAYGESGEVTITLSAWKNMEALIAVEGIGKNDMIIFSPKTAADRHVLNSASVFISPEVTDGMIKITALRELSDDVVLVYFISRGA